MFHYVQDELKAELASGRLVVVEDPEPFFALLNQRYPMGLNRIDWDKVPDGHRVHVLPRPKSIDSDEVKALLERCSGKVRDWLREVEFATSSSVIWLGDMTDVALEVSGTALFELFPTLCSFPQQSYLFPRDGAWCLNYVMEGELFFGKAPPRAPRRGG